MPRSLTRWDPFAELPRLLPRDLGAWLDEQGFMKAEWSPRSEVTETEEAVVVRAELPGVEEKDMHVEVSDGMLHVRGEKKSEVTEEEKGRTRSERFYGSFERSYALPEGAQTDKIEAKLKDGVLEVTVPRAKPVEPAAKRIQIKGA